MSILSSSLSRKIRGAAFCLALASQAALAAHSVSIVKAEPVLKTVHLTLTADALGGAADDDAIPRPGGSYRLIVRLPSGVTPDLTVGSSVAVALPTIHNNKARATIKSISKTRVELVLADQVQILEGQRLQVILPLKPGQLFRIPFQAVYSPRGLTSEVFLLSPEKRVFSVPVVPLQVHSGGMIVVSSDRLAGADIVAQGTDNLLSGDGVRVVDAKEARIYDLTEK